MNIYCIGRNYAEHAKELGNAVPEEPMVFLKPSGAFVQGDSTLKIPLNTQQLDHEVEVVLKMGANGKIEAVAIGIDFTARDLQKKAKEKGAPWVLSKGMNGFAPVGNWVEASLIQNLESLEFGIEVNGELKQKGSPKEMIFSIPKLIQYLSTHFTLVPGDLIFTGTPAGVSKLKAGDVLTAWMKKNDNSKPISALKVKIS